ncbi:MAG: hypothetical protein BMS9Abin26_0209 [Gammaproteobacteria bacterium]|nr:MAG: hypothetical protein BMS9Abin26_0209 [Gammaproteobacteria bacterium]
MYKIMIVDDEENILKALRRVLAREKGWETEYFSSISKALRRANTNNFDLFLSDYRMPEMNGVDFLSQVKELQPEAVRLILSGFTDLEALMGAINEAQIFRFICKPWEDIDLLATMKQALQHRALLVENRRLADQVRAQRKQLDRQQAALEELEAEHPGITRVDRAPDGSILLDEKKM